MRTESVAHVGRVEQGIASLGGSAGRAEPSVAAVSAGNAGDGLAEAGARVASRSADVAEGLRGAVQTQPAAGEAPPVAGLGDVAALRALLMQGRSSMLASALAPGRSSQPGEGGAMDAQRVLDLLTGGSVRGREQSRAEAVQEGASPTAGVGPGRPMDSGGPF